MSEVNQRAQIAYLQELVREYRERAEKAEAALAALTPAPLSSQQSGGGQ
jgi:hypothetical protein